MTTKGKIAGTLIGILLVALLIASYFTFTCYSDGKRAGNVIKFSHKGMIFKTWEGELIQRNLSLAPSDTWHFSVQDPAVAKQIEDAMSKGQHLDMEYCEKFYKFFWQGETNYFITNAKAIPAQ
jgi:hypothetical protein